MSHVLFSQKQGILYIGDPMCSWCYGFSPELDKIKAAFPTKKFEMIMGGLRPDGEETIGDLSEFLMHHWQEVQKKSGQKFNYGILKTNPNAYYNTEPACRAVIVMRQFDPEKEYEYFKAVQRSFYIANNHPAEEEVYSKIAEEMGLNEDKFYKALVKMDAKVASYADFEKARSLGVSGFPALMAYNGDKVIQICKGYEKADTAIKKLNQFFAE
jgi:putative protein-disulfide isomerase